MIFFFEVLLDRMRIFGIVQPQSESTSLFLNIMISKKMRTLGPPSSTLGGDRHIRPLTFLNRIQRSTTFIWSDFGYNAYFQQHLAPKWIYLLIFEHYNISKVSNLWSPLALLRGARRFFILAFLMKMSNKKGCNSTTRRHFKCKCWKLQLNL